MRTLVTAAWVVVALSAFVGLLLFVASSLKASTVDYCASTRWAAHLGSKRVVRVLHFVRSEQPAWWVVTLTSAVTLAAGAGRRYSLRTPTPTRF